MWHIVWLTKNDIWPLLQKRFLVLIVVILGVPSALAMTLSSDYEHYDLATVVEYFEDPTGKLGIDDIRSAEFSSRFKKASASDSDVNFGFSASSYWLRFTMTRNAEAPREWLLEIPSFSLSHIEWYAPGEAPVITGEMHPVATRPVFHRYYVFPLQVEIEPQVFYVRVQSQKPVTVPLRIWQSQAFAENSNQTLLIQSLYYGGILALVLYNSLLYVSLRDRNFLLYSLFASFFGLGILTGNGMARLMLWPEWIAWDQIAESTLLSLGAACGMLFTQVFLRTRTYAPRFHWLLTFTFWAFVLIAVGIVGTTALGNSVQNLLQVLVLLGTVSGLLVIVTGIVVFRAGNLSARWFLLAWGILWGGVFIAGLRAFGLIPTNTVTAFALQIASALEMILLSFALADRIHLERNAREQAQFEAIKAKQMLVESLQQSEENLERNVRERTDALENSLRNEQQLREQYIRFGALISHEFRNPLGVIDGQIALLLKERERGIDQTQKRLQAIRNAASRLDNLFDEWLQVDSLSHRMQSLRKVSLPAHSWLEQFISESCVCQLTHRLDLVFRDEVQEIYADEALLQIALTNLLDNACKYSPADTTITLTLLTREGMVGFQVVDEGTGIAPANQAHVFDEYFRANQSQSIRGLGLGLPFVKKIANQHGGNVELKSELGSGSCFTFWISSGERSNMAKES